MDCEREMNATCLIITGRTFLFVHCFIWLDSWECTWFTEFLGNFLNLLSQPLLLQAALFAIWLLCKHFDTWPVR